jgi:hypothetical protein
MFRDRKSPQQTTLSIRISESFRAFLERARKQFSDTRGESLSISDVAKLLLESAAENRLDDRLETTDLLARPTEALLRIRRKWEDNQELTRAEWTVLAQYAEAGCEQLSSDPELPSRESFAQVLEAFVAVWSLRLHVTSDIDRYYLGNLSGWTDQDKALRTGGQPDPEIVPAVVRRMIRDLRESSGNARPSHAARNLYVALRDERLQGAASLHRALVPFLPCLYRVAARGHWLVEQRPIREERKPWETLDWVPERVPDVAVGDFVLSSVVGQEGDLHMQLKLKSRRVSYWLGPYPNIRDFQTMLERLVPGRSWNGRHFYGQANDVGSVGADTYDAASAFYFGESAKGVRVAFSAEEWCDLKHLFEKAVKLPELQGTFEALALAYGEV